MSHLNSFILTIYTASAAAILSAAGVGELFMIVGLLVVVLFGSIIEEALQRLVQEETLREEVVLTGFLAGLGSVALAHGFANSLYLLMLGGLGFMWISLIFLELSME